MSYPEAAPTPRDRVRYTWELQTNSHPVQRAQFVTPDNAGFNQ
jgi:hypothetical protein